MGLAESTFGVTSNFYSGVSLKKIGSKKGSTDFGPGVVYGMPTISFEVNGNYALLMKVNYQLFF